MITREWMDGMEWKDGWNGMEGPGMEWMDGRNGSGNGLAWMIMGSNTNITGLVDCVICPGRHSMEAGWKAVLADEFDKAYFQQIRYLLLAANEMERSFPPGSQIFNGHNPNFPFEQVKVVILGSDPIMDRTGPWSCVSVYLKVLNHRWSISQRAGKIWAYQGRHTETETWARQGVFAQCHANR